MTYDDKEFLLEVLDELTVVLSQHAFEKTSPEIWNKIARAMTIIERSCYKESTHSEGDHHDWHNSNLEELDFNNNNNE